MPLLLVAPFGKGGQGAIRSDRKIALDPPFSKGEARLPPLVDCVGTTAAASAAVDQSQQERANLWAICAAQFLTMAGITAVLPLLPLYLQQIGIVDRDTLRYWTGILGSAPFAVAVFATPVWGAFADRVGHKPMVVRSVVGISLATLGMGLSYSPLSILGCRALQGAVSGVFPAAVSLITAMTPQARIGRSLALLQSARAAGALSGPLLGGLAADLIGIRPLFFIAGGVSLLTAGLCAAVIREAPRQRDASSVGAEGTRWTELLNDRPTLATFTLIALFQLTVICSWPTLALFVGQFDVPASAVATTTGLVVFATGLPNMLTATWWARLGRRFGLQTIIAVSLLFTGVANVAMAGVSRIHGLLLVRVFAGLSMAGFLPLAFEYVNARTPAGARGRAAGLGSTAMMLGNVIGPLLGGWLAVHVSLAATFWAPGAGLGVIGMVLAVAAAVGRSRVR
jgi:MFS transporter, DHA1 family, multidrug resistance protein